MEEFFDILTDIHCKEKGHIGSKKTLSEVCVLFRAHVFIVGIKAV